MVFRDQCVGDGTQAPLQGKHMHVPLSAYSLKSDSVTYSSYFLNLFRKMWGNHSMYLSLHGGKECRPVPRAVAGPLWALVAKQGDVG